MKKEKTKKSKQKKTSEEKFRIATEIFFGVLLLLAIIWAQQQGYYNRTQYIIDCNEDIIAKNGFHINTNITFTPETNFAKELMKERGFYNENQEQNSTTTTQSNEEENARTSQKKS